MFVEGKSRAVFFSSDTLIYGISRDGSKNYNIRTCEHVILGQEHKRSMNEKWSYQPKTNLYILHRIWLYSLSVISEQGGDSLKQSHKS